MLLFLALLSTVCGLSKWYVGSGLTDIEVDSLLQSGCFHGRYGGGPLKSSLVLSLCPKEGLEAIGTFSSTTPLCVIEFKRNLELKFLQQAEAIINAHNDTALMYKSERDFIISSPRGKLCDEGAFPDRWVTNTITVPLLPYNKPRGRIMSFNLTEPNPKIQHAISLASSASQEAFLDKLSSYWTRSSLSEDAMDAAEYLTEMYTSYGFEVSRFDFSDGYSPNIVAELNGQTHPDQIVVIGAHYDSRSTNSYDVTLRAPGADDNGSGTMNLLELARIIGENKLTFDYTIRLCSFSGEEQGLLGSRAMAKQWAEDGVDVVAMFNGDMLGWKLPNTPITLGMKDRYVALWLLEVANTVTSLYVPELPISVSPSCCSDHQGFTEAGYPAVGFFENPGSASDYPHYHKSTDLIQYVNFEQALLISRAMMANLMTFAGLK